MQDLKAAREYVESIDLSGLQLDDSIEESAQLESLQPVFETAKNQAQVVGSSLLSFATGVDSDVREAISDSALLAQLVANKHASAEAKPLDWYAKYLEVLGNVGWVLQGGEWSDYTASGSSAEVHQKTVEVLTVALGPSAAAMAIVKSAIDALAEMQTESPWLTIFTRESQHANIARFQIGLVEAGEDAGVYVSLLACLITAKATFTQVLAFKFRDEQASFRASAARVSINRPSLKALGPTIREKVRAFQIGYLGGIENL